MAYIQFLEAQLTHKYVGTYSHLERFAPLGNVKVLGGRDTPEPDEPDISDAGGRIFRVVAPSAMVRQHGAETIRRALSDLFTSWGCAHDYDCCGCVSSMAYVKRAGRREFVVRQSFTRNY
jgi:hypothetical protein